MLHQMPFNPDNLRHLVERSGRTYTDIARAAGMTPQQLANIAHGHRRDPRINTMQRIANALDCSLDEMVSNAEKKT